MIGEENFKQQAMKILGAGGFQVKQVAGGYQIDGATVPPASLSILLDSGKLPGIVDYTTFDSEIMVMAAMEAVKKALEQLGHARSVRDHAGLSEIEEELALLNYSDVDG